MFGQDNRWRHLSGKPPSKQGLPWEPWKTTTSIGQRCKCSNAFSWLVLIARLAWSDPVTARHQPCRSDRQKHVEHVTKTWNNTDVWGVKTPLSLLWSGGHSRRKTPDPIPNSEVKRCCGDDSLGVALRENSSMPGLIFNNNAPSILLEGVLFFGLLFTQSDLR